MDDARSRILRDLATEFRAAIEAARAERLPGALPYFPDGACRMTSRLFAQHLSRRARQLAAIESRLPLSKPAA